MKANEFDALKNGSASDQFDYDVVGVGALNLDYIASSSTLGRKARGQAASLADRLTGLLGMSDAPIEWGAERRVDASAVYTALEAMDAESIEVNLGGSAFNAISAIAQTNLGLRLGYVGIAGRMPIPGISSIRHMEMLGIDHSGVQKRQDALYGICLSFIEDGERTLLTHGGANESMADYLQSNFDAVVAYLASARVVHLTSFLDPHTPARMCDVIKAVKCASPDTLFSFDPGHVWATSPSPEIEMLVGLADYLLVNNREFRALGGCLDGDDETAVAARVLQRTRPGGMVLIKKPTGITTYRTDGASVRTEFYRQARLADNAVEDATGAGDVFAAGLLAVITADRLKVELGALLGMALARHKLKYVGHSGHSHFPKIARSIIRSLDEGRRAPVEPLGVFIAHGGNSDWLAVKDLVERELELPAHFFERQSWGSMAVTEAIEANLSRCSFAVCVLTVEDLTVEGKRLARQNVIHEIGLFQGRYGFNRVLVLAEDGCDYVPQVAMPYAIGFPHNGIRSTFWRLRNMIKERSAYAVQR